MGDVKRLARKAFDVSVCLSDERIDELVCTDLSINEDNTFLTLTTITGVQRTYCLAQVIYFETLNRDA